MNMKNFEKFLDNNISHITGKVFNKNSIPVSCNASILQWMVDNQVKSYENSKKNLLQNLIDELTNIFGNPNKTLRLEFMTKLWILKFNDLIFNVFTAKNKGTSIELCNYSYDEITNNNQLKNNIIEFLSELHKLINKR